MGASSYPKESLPTVEQLRTGTCKRCLILEPLDNTVLSDMEGFWPGRYQDDEAGCEFYFGETDYDWLEEMNLTSELLSSKDMTCDLSFFGDPRDLVTAAIVVDYLCTECDGSVYSEDDESFLAGESNVYWAKQLLHEANQMIQDE